MITILLIASYSMIGLGFSSISMRDYFSWRGSLFVGVLWPLVLVFGFFIVAFVAVEGSR